jgi:para-aminobenzoate synthetase component 1
VLLHELPYIPDSSRLFEIIAHRPWAIFLDSSRPKAAGRWDILAADPIATFVTRGSITELRCNQGLTVSQDDPFNLLRNALNSRFDRSNAESGDKPFAGGAIGWFGYDLARRIERLPIIAAATDDIPDMVIGIFDWAVLVDHESKRTWLASYVCDPNTKQLWPKLIRMWQKLPDTPIHHPFRVLDLPRPNLNYEQYTNAFNRIHHYIRNGDCYQVNFALNYTVNAEGDSWTAYKVLRNLNPAPFSAFLKTPYGQILSSSPERFLKVQNDTVETCPIKGTRPRSNNVDEDWKLGKDLVTSVKDRAENLMIVDLLRNDLGRVCVPGSILVPQLFKLEKYATVQHLVSTITGQLAPGQDALTLLRSCFPGGSITGAPKIRAMQIIEELEPKRRGVYCGAIGYIGFDGAMDTNIVIRTLIYNNSTIKFWAGGGIVYDSTVEQEYEEIMNKAEAILQLLRNFSERN